MQSNPSIEQSLRFFSSEMFHQVQMSGMFDDSKQFADATPRVSWGEIYQQYQLQSTKAEFDLHAFVEHFFELPQPIELLPDHAQQDVAQHIEKLWERLLKQPDSQQANSLLALEYPYLVPGGRFREIYYWDSYFTALGLMESGREHIVESMIRNFIQLQQQVGCIPNGNRSYYYSRSQPPVLALMVELLTGADMLSLDSAFFASCLDAMESEYHYWMGGSEELTGDYQGHRHVVRMPNGGLLNRFWDPKALPRPESYREDIEAAATLPSHEQQQFFRNIRAACESGWDFSSRWLADPHDLKSIQTTDIIPVDLNSLLYKLELLLGEYFAALHDSDKASLYRQKAQQRINTINQYLWCDEQQMFVDFNIKTGRPSPVVSLAAAVPLFVGIANQQQAQSVASILEKKFLYPGGLVTTICQSDQQWDAPNGWAPLQWFAVKGLSRYGFDDLAMRVIKAWLNTVESYFAEHHCLMEKYNVASFEQAAKGGEYEVQHGFGWTNGVTLAFYAMLDKG